MNYYLHYHAWDVVNERIVRAGSNPDPFDKIGRTNPFPKEVLDSTVWGITKKDNQWYFTGKLVPSWLGHKEDLPEDISPIKIQGKDQYAACSPEEVICEHGLYGPLDGLGSITIPSFGISLDEVAKKSQRLQGFLHQIDTAIEYDDWD